MAEGDVSVTAMEVLFWFSVFGVIYPYLGYPAVLWLLGGVLGRERKIEGEDPPFYPSISMIIPVCNEEKRIERKLANTEALRYPADRLQVLFVSDGSTDRTVELIRKQVRGAMTLIERPVRQGKAAALNAGLEHATHDIVIFSDASIELESDALRHIVQGFRDPAIGCISGEDKIAESGGEAWYGRYELLIRRLAVAKRVAKEYQAIGRLEQSINSNFDNAEEVITYLKTCRNNPKNWQSTSLDTQFLLPSEWMLKV